VTLLGSWREEHRLREFENIVLERIFGPKRQEGGSRDSSVGLATGYALDGPGSIPGSARFFSSPQRLDLPWDPHSFLSNGYRGFFPREVKRQGREANHSPPFSVDVKKSGAIPPLLHMPLWHCA
jgi:hypothetical protein